MLGLRRSLDVDAGGNETVDCLGVRARQSAAILRRPPGARDRLADLGPDWDERIGGHVGVGSHDELGSGLDGMDRRSAWESS